jgi:hypothetical protein
MCRGEQIGTTCTVSGPLRHVAPLKIQRKSSFFLHKKVH